MLEVRVDVDGRPLSRYGCDGVICATPTGSTAYAFSAGGPVVWPEVEALLLVPISAHALFSRALVTSPDVDHHRSPSTRTPRPRCCAATAGGCSTCRRAAGSPSAGAMLPVRVARLRPRPFTDRLVAKFALPVEGWRANSHDVIVSDPTGVRTATRCASRGPVIRGRHAIRPAPR